MRKLGLLIVVCAVGFFMLAGCENKEDQNRIAELETELSQIKAKLSEVLEENKSLNQKIEDMRNQVAEAEAVSKASKRIEGQLSAIEQEKTAITKQLADSQQRIKDLTGQVEKYMKDLTSLKKTNKELNSLIEQLQTDTAQLQVPGQDAQEQQPQEQTTEDAEK